LRLVLWYVGVRFCMCVANWSSCKTLVAGLFPTMPTTLANAFLPNYPPSTSSNNTPSDHSHSYSASPPNASSSPTHHPTTPPPSSSSSGGFSFPFTMDFDKRHREAVSCARPGALRSGGDGRGKARGVEEAG
jgi:hypothetical protein